jgi:hypothetical protein
MSSVRQFCRDSEYPIAVFLTYTFDPLFFERVPLADLAIGGSRRLIIAADAGQVAEAMRRCAGQIAHLGRRYVLAETTLTNTFHPKLIAKLSPAGGQVWIGSGNLTHPGWGGNCELATSWRIGPDEDDKGTWLNRLLAAVSTLTRSTTFADQLRSIRHEIPWLTAPSPSVQQSPVLVGMPNEPLAPQLADRWRGRHFDKLFLCTGSTDVDGAFLAWANRTFGIKEAIICLTPAYASFDPAKFAKLPLDIRIIPADPEKYMHAKFYWFSGVGGNAAIVGSANCSAAAWLSRNSNIELVIPYDDPQAADFSSVLSVFDLPKETPHKVLTAKPAPQDQNGSTPFRHRLASVRLRHDKMIEAVLDPPPASDAPIDLIVLAGSGTATIRLAANSRTLFGRLPMDFDLGSMTPFAYAQSIADGVLFTTEPRWIDNDARLERFAQFKQAEPGFEDLSRRSLLRSNYQRVLEAVQVVSAQLLAPPPDKDLAQSARTSASPAGGSGEKTGAAPPIDPSTMIRNLNDLKRQTGSPAGARPFAYSGSLAGVIGMLFAQEEDDDVDLSGETWSAAEPEKDPDDNRQQQNKPPPPPPPPEEKTQSDAAASIEARLAFHDEIEAFLTALSRPSFAETCDAPRMVQALAFPLLLCVRGNEAEWLPAAELASVATRVAEFMFEQSYGQGKPRGLFNMVRGRYLHEGRFDEFLRAVGDGTLWVSLLAALSIDPTLPVQIVVRQAAALASVFRCAELFAAVSEPAKLSALVRSLLIRNAEHHITEKAKRIAQASDGLAALLCDGWDALYQEQGKGRRLAPGGSLLWSRHWGWYATPKFPAESSQSGYINLITAADDHADIQEAVARIIDASR